MSFVQFTAVNQRSVNEISITASNTFNFPSKFFIDNRLDRYKYVSIFYDEGRKAVGFHFTNDEDEKYKFKLQKSKKGYGGFISATSFFKVNNINSIKHKGRYIWKIERPKGVGRLFVIELNDGRQKSLAPEKESTP